MQGTIVMLMALSGLGCHNKCYDVAYTPPSYSCFGGGCYANVYPTQWASPQGYAGCYSAGYSGCYATAYAGCFGGGCFGGCYGSCYSGGYGGYGHGHHGCGLFARLFSCCGWKNRSYYAFDPYGMGSYGMGGGYGNYDPAIFGYALQYNYGTMADEVGPAATSATPSEAAPVPPNPVTPAPTPGSMTTPPTTPAPPTPVTPAPPSGTGLPSSVTPSAPPPPSPADVAPKPKT